MGREIILEQIKFFGEYNPHPDGMEVDPALQVYYKQFDYTYDVKGNGKCVKSGKLKINLYLDPVRRSSELVYLDSEIKLQEEDIIRRINEQIPCEDDATLKRKLRYFKVQYDPATRLTKSYSLDERMVEKSQLRFDKQQNCSEEEKTGRLFILFLSLILTSYIRHIWKTTELRKLFESSLDILDEMRSIRCIEHTNKAKLIAPFAGVQVDICDAFGLAIPDGCSPDYRSKRKEPKRHGRPRKPLTEREV